MKKEIGYILLSIKIDYEEDQWVAVCQEMGVAADGESLDEALEALREFIGMHLHDLDETGERERFFLENGIAILPSPPAPESLTVMLGGGVFPEIVPLQYVADSFVVTSI